MIDILAGMIAAVSLFVPGIALLNLLWMGRASSLSAVERVVVGAVIWSSFFVFGSYFTSVLTNSVLSFFQAFAIASAVLLAFGVLQTAWRLRGWLTVAGLRPEKVPFALVLAALLLFVLSVMMAHSIYEEYDALSYYLPLAKSVLLTGGLRFDFYHQTVQTTAIEPAVPLMYAFAGYLAGGQSAIATASRFIAFAFVCLTSAAVYLAAREVSRKEVVGLASAGVYLAIPATLTMAADYSLYLDEAFVFFVALILYALVKVYTSGAGNQSWWTFLGLSLGLALFERDITYFIAFPVFGVLILLCLRSRTSAPSILGAAAGSVVFAGAYNFFFVYNLYTSSTGLPGLLVTEAPVVFLTAVFFLLALSRLDGMSAPRPSTLLYAGIPLVLVAGLVLRNVLVTQSISSDLPFTTPVLREALSLLSEASGSSSTPTSLAQLFKWDTIFRDLQLGALFLVPLVLGLAVCLWRAVDPAKDSAQRTRYFILVASFLAMLLVWSWLFGSSYLGPEVRRLYYLAPFVAVFGGMGLGWISDRLDPSSAMYKVPLFLAATTAYFWYEGAGQSWSMAKVASSLGRLGDLNLSLLLSLSAILVLALYPLRAGSISVGRAPSGSEKAIAVLFILALSSFVGYNSATVLSNESQTANSAYSGWENGLSSVIQYLNSNQNNSYAIITTDGDYLAYFTPHPTIESITYYGLENLLSMNGSASNMTGALLSGGVHYILVPRPPNSFYNFTTRLGANLTVMNQAVIDHDPNIVLIQGFPKYDLYEVVADPSSGGSYAYITNFTGSKPLDPTSIITPLPQGISVTGGTAGNVSITSGAQALFWTPAKSSPTDKISLANDPAKLAGGSSSLRISLNGTGGLTIDHYYSQPQSWSNASVLSFLFDGAGTSKSVTLTFHTNGWNDYFAKAFVDNFTGWRLMQFPLDSFARYGRPSWSSISFIEFLMNDRTATYWMGDLSLGGYALGVSGTIPPQSVSGTKATLVASVGGNASTSFPLELVVSTTNATMSFALQPGVNSVSVPSWYLTQGATFEIVQPTLSPGDSLELYYLGVLALSG